MDRIRMTWCCYGLSGVVIAGGIILASRTFPPPFEWSRTVISALASRKYNPGGGFWLAGALGLGFLLLWPVAVAISGRILGPRARTGADPATARSGLPAAARAGALLRAGLLCGLLVAVERVAFFHFSDLMHKGHEALAVVAFLGIYAGEMDLEIQHARRRTSARWMAALVLLPVIAAALVLALYLEQRHLGWLDLDGGGPLAIWQRFPFWQWIALAALWAGLGHLLWIGPAGNRGVAGGHGTVVGRGTPGLPAR